MPSSICVVRDARGAHCGELMGEDYPCAAASPNRPDKSACQIEVRSRADALRHCELPCVAFVLNQESTWATLKMAHRWTPPHELHDGNHLSPCQELSKRLCSSSEMKTCDKGMADAWDRFGCSDYVLNASWGALTLVDPDRFIDVLPSPREASPAPANIRGGALLEQMVPLILTFADRPSRGLCRSLYSAILNDVPVTVLGWQPSSPHRWQFWYVASKFLMAEELVRRRRLGPHAPVLILDGTDVLFQGGIDILSARAGELLANRSAIFSAEAYCVPCSAGEQHTLSAMAYAHRPASSGAAGSLHPEPGRERQAKGRGGQAARSSKSPVNPRIFNFLNSGGLLVRASVLRPLVDRFAAATLQQASRPSIGIRVSRKQSK